jgi:hypothetical protein
MKYLINFNINLLKPKTYFMYHQLLTYRSYVFCPQFIYVFCVDLGGRRIIKKKIINLSVFITNSVYCAVRAGSLNQTDTVSSLKV